MSAELTTEITKFVNEQAQKIRDLEFQLRNAEDADSTNMRILEEFQTQLERQAKALDAAQEALERILHEDNLVGLIWRIREIAAEALRKMDEVMK